MSEALLAEPKQKVSDVVGYVEALSGAAALGWAWRPGTTDRLTVELRHAERTVARGRADNLRDDLARGGIGDGRHAFSLPIPDELRSRCGELQVVVNDDNAMVILSMPPAPDNGFDRSAPVQRGLEMLIGSQRVLHRNLQAALLQQPSITEALTEIAALQASLKASIDTVELFAIRLEQALARQEAPASVVPGRRGLSIVAGVAGLALIGSCFALWRAIAG